MLISVSTQAAPIYRATLSPNNATTQQATILVNLPVQDCTEQVKACEAVVDAGQQYIQHLSKQNEQQTALAKALEAEVALLKQRAVDLAPAFYEKPAFVAITTIILTAGTITLIKKASQ